jgi:hypothetical protein
MDFQINKQHFLAFLTKARIGGLVKDLNLQATDKIFARFCDQHRTMYGEVYESNVKINEPGSIRIGSIDQVISVIGRSDGELLRVKLIENYFVITDGSKAGKFKARIATPGVAEFIESFQPIKDKPKQFSIADLSYIDGKYKYETGYEIPYESLTELLRDAKAFGFENYEFNEKDGILNCTIMNVGTKDSFIRRLLTIGKISDQPIPDVTVGHGFREIVSCLDKEICEKGKLAVKIYFNKISLLITNGVSYFINLHVKD